MIEVQESQVEETKSYKVTATFLLTDAMLQSEQTFTARDIFEAFVQNEEVVEESIDGELLAKVRAMPNHQEPQIIAHVQQVMPGRFTDEQIRLAIQEVRK